MVSTNHTVRRDEDITVTLADGRRSPGALVGRDAGTDLAVLRIETVGASTNAVSTTADDELRVGNLVLAAGRIHRERGVSASLGIVSALGSAWRTWRGGEIDRLIRPDVSVFIGFSGGPLVDAEGQVVGINTTGLARGAGLTIPSATVNRVVEELLQHGHIARPYLGVGMQPVTLPDELRTKFNLPGTGALVMLSVEPEAPAGRAGIALGDVLVAIDGAPVTDTDEVQSVLSASKVGQTISATILRGGERRDVELTLGERPNAKGK